MFWSISINSNPTTSTFGIAVGANTVIASGGGNGNYIGFARSSNGGISWQRQVRQFHRREFEEQENWRGPAEARKRIYSCRFSVLKQHSHTQIVTQNTLLTSVSFPLCGCARKFSTINTKTIIFVKHAAHCVIVHSIMKYHD